MTTSTALPRWDLQIVFPSTTDESYVASMKELRAGIDRVQGLFDEYGIGLLDGAHPDTDAEHIINTWNEVSDHAELISNYLYCWTSVDSNDAAAASAYGEFEMVTSKYRALAPRLTTWMGTLKVAEAADGSVLADHAYPIRRAAIGAKHVMSPELEDLAAELQSTGGQAWVRARDDFDAGMTATITLDGESKSVSITELDAELSSPDRSRRKAASEAMEAARESGASAFMLALNAVKGEALTLSRRRNWDSPLDWSLFVSAIDRDILAAMFSAAESVHGDLHRYLKAKAAMLGIEKMAHYDLAAPISADEEKLEWEQCVKLARDVLVPFSPRLARVVDESLDKRWIDAEPREGKVGGGYCAGMGKFGSRIMLNFVPSFGIVQTLAHELGHAHHNDCLMERTSLQTETPMTLAETASMFCQRLVEDAVLAEAPAERKLAALDQILSEAVGLILDLHARFNFELEFFELRKSSTVSVEDLTNLMAEKQRVAFGDALDHDQVHKWQWVQKPHYYDTDFHFYNYPYQFGLLFALGLLKVYRDQPDGFAERYESLLSRTGMATAAELALDFGIDIRDKAFWDGSVSVIRDDVNAFVALAG